METVEEVGLDDSEQKLTSFWSHLHLPQKILLILGTGLTLVGVLLLTKSVFQDETKVEIVESATTDNKKEETKKVFVDVSGAVLKPGVYSLDQGERIQSALAAAGGLAADADREWVAKNLNLAGKLTDGAKIYVPRAAEGKTTLFNLSEKSNSSNLVNINTATAAQLDSLPGVGPATASKIIANRPYQTIGELVSKRVVSSRVFEGFKERISLY